MALYEVSGIGTAITLKASQNFPVGISITALADDADPLAIPELAIGDSAMGANGDHLSWRVYNAIEITLNVIAQSADDKDLSVLFSANAPGQGKTLSHDELTLVAVYPDGSSLTLSDGTCISYMPGDTWGQGGKLKTKMYKMRFGQATRTGV